MCQQKAQVQFVRAKAKHQYVLTTKKALLGDTVVMRKLIECFMSQQSSAYQDMTKSSRRTAIAQVAAHRLISKAMQLRKQHIGVLLKAVRNVCGLDIKEQCDFCESLHSYNFEHRPSVLVVDSCGRCRHTWKCSSKCTPLTEKHLQKKIFRVAQKHMETRKSKS